MVRTKHPLSRYLGIIIAFRASVIWSKNCSQLLKCFTVNFAFINRDRPRWLTIGRNNHSSNTTSPRHFYLGPQNGFRDHRKIGVPELETGVPEIGSETTEKNSGTTEKLGSQKWFRDHRIFDSGTPEWILGPQKSWDHRKRFRDKQRRILGPQNGLWDHRKVETTEVGSGTTEICWVVNDLMVVRLDDLVLT